MTHALWSRSSRIETVCSQSNHVYAELELSKRASKATVLCNYDNRTIVTCLYSYLIFLIKFPMTTEIVADTTPAMKAVVRSLMVRNYRQITLLTLFSRLHSSSCPICFGTDRTEPDSSNLPLLGFGARDPLLADSCSFHRVSTIPVGPYRLCIVCVECRSSN